MAHVAECDRANTAVPSLRFKSAATNLAPRRHICAKSDAVLIPLCRTSRRQYTVTRTRRHVRWGCSQAQVSDECTVGGRVKSADSRAARLALPFTRSQGWFHPGYRHSQLRIQDPGTFLDDGSRCTVTSSKVGKRPRSRHSLRTAKSVFTIGVSAMPSSLPDSSMPHALAAPGLTTTTWQPLWDHNLWFHKCRESRASERWTVWVRYKIVSSWTVNSG